jgi:hypothetical protein
MKNGLKVFLGVVAFIVIMLALSWGLGWFDVFTTKTVGKAKENAKTEMLENTQGYVRGMRETLAKYHHEWLNATADNKIAIESVVRHEFANFDGDTYLTGDLFEFYKTVMNK